MASQSRFRQTPSPQSPAPRLAPLITAIGVSIVLQQVAMLVWGRNYHSVPQLLPAGAHEVFGAHITDVQLIIMATAALTMLGLMQLVNRTRLGRAMRACAESPTASRLCGIRPSSIVAFSFFMVSQIQFDAMPENFSSHWDRMKALALVIAAIGLAIRPRLLLFPFVAAYILFGLVREGYRLFYVGVGKVTGRPYGRRKTDRRNIDESE